MSIVKKPPSKSELRAQLQREVQEYLEHGGQIEEVPAGVSGRDDNRIIQTPVFDTPKSERTPVPEVVASIESRRRQKPAAQPPKKVRRSPREKIIYDDFGEPVRKVWVDD